MSEVKCPDCQKVLTHEYATESCPKSLYWHGLHAVAVLAPALECFKEIKPIGLRIIDNPKLERWTKQGYVSQEADGLWLHYTAICELLREVTTE